jgi:predicted O-linked N-acetylglucosamine transferase (SPINDLY family)
MLNLPDKRRAADAIKLALQHHQAGRLQQAEQIYQAILSVDPDHAEANHLLGVLAHQAGKHAVAAQYIARAILKDGNQAPYYNNLGRVLQAQGRLEEALMTYQEAIAINPDYVDAHNNRGVVLQIQGRLEEALAAYERVLAVKPEYADVHNNRGSVLQAQGRYEEALAAYQQALAVKPDYAEAYNNRGNALQAQGKYEEALAAYQQALAIKPDYAGAHNNRGVVLQAQGRFDEALAAYRQAITIQPDYTEAYNNRGNALQAQGKYEEALAVYQQALAIKSDHAGTHYNRGNVLLALGRLEEALAAYEQALAIQPDYADAHNNRGITLETLGRLEEALAAYEQALAVRPGHADAHNNRGVVLQIQGRLEEALAAFQRVLELEPGFADAHNNRGNALSAQGRLQEAMAAYRQALAVKPDFHQACSNMLFCMNYDAGIGAQALYAAHREWDARFAAGLVNGTPRHTNMPDPERRLRIGYVSPDYYRHPAASFIEPLLAAHDRRSYGVVCYSNVTRPDAVTARLQKLADRWRTITGMSDEQVAALVREDGIDILVDLAGHTGGNRLRVFARKPAPVQVTYLGYPSTTGLSVMDFRLSDGWIDPPGLTDAYHSEEIVRLPRGSVCFQPPASSPAVADIPDIIPGRIIFASFNNAAKVTPEVVALWSEVLHAVPEARLILKARQLGDRETVQRLRGLFEHEGVAADQLDFASWIPDSEAHLAFYNRAHIALDTFPYSGCTTTCEALWMGVPVITLAGQESRSRMSLSILKQVGLDNCIAESPAAYIGIARTLAADTRALQRVRAGLRRQVQMSSLLDAEGFARAVESAYRGMWRRWCRYR